jgi:hypothetical protein
MEPLRMVLKIKMEPFFMSMEIIKPLDLDRNICFMMAMKHFFMDDFEEKVPELLELLSGLIKYKDSDIQFLEALLRYLGTNKKHDIDWLKSKPKKSF